MLLALILAANAADVRYAPPPYRSRPRVHRYAPPPYRYAPPPPPPPATRAAPAPAGDHDVSILLNLVQAPNPLLSGQAEVALGERVALVATGGIGANEITALYDVGGAVRAYPLGDFDAGLFVSGGLGATNFTPVSAGLHAMSLDTELGGKFALAFGLTAEAAVGVSYLDTPEYGVITPTARVAVGWSF